MEAKLRKGKGEISCTFNPGFSNVVFASNLDEHYFRMVGSEA